MPVGDRVLATVLFTDIAGSTSQTGAVGDRTWKAVLSEHDDTAERVVAARGGRVVKSTGDGILAVFDTPGRAVDAALRLVDEAAAIGLTLRAGLHCGEVELRGEDVTGMAVNLAARIEADAPSGSVVVSSTVADLVVGSDLCFTPLGSRSYAGIDRKWEVFAATR